MSQLKILSLFSGMGAFEKALKNLGIGHEVVNYCEWEEPIAKSYSILHNIPMERNLGDISKVDETKLPDFDLMTYGFPCTDVSVAKVNGLGLEGGQSGLLYEALRIAEHKLPKYMIAENVKNLVGKHKAGFEDMLKRLEGMGYNNYWKVLDAKDFGVPQERHRVFVVSIRKDIDDGKFTFPTARPSTSRTSSWWEFLNPYETRNLTNRQQRMVDVAKGLNKDDSIKFEGEVQFDCAIITLRQSGLRFQDNPHHPTITSYYGKGGGNFTILAYKGHIGGITPKQCFQLMGFDESDHDKLVAAGISRSNLYIMAGNSIVVNVIEDIFKNLFEKGGELNA
ncbi:DNA (cytosine-5-)-methyltransferase [Pseudobacillus badius]|uniref:DNA (cytosine-5-)-methyltransferase n=1 Tax=Bacillus badius TaxID=1455 RepID=UPI0007B33313|nr:DNA (cytosine-5-)-methyltransferase [Bacillus badius]KZR57892.1 hypothetical protein A3781_19135 [Bacillus badius]